MENEKLCELRGLFNLFISHFLILRVFLCMREFFGKHSNKHFFLL